MSIPVKLDPNFLLRKSEIIAVSEAMQHGIQARVISRDGVALPNQMTEEFVPNRWDLVVENGFVVGVHVPPTK